MAISAFWRGGTFALAGVLPFLVAFGLLLTWWQTIAPGSDRDWSPQLARTVSVMREGDVLTFANVRNFRWVKASPERPDIGSGEAIADERWETRAIDLAKVDGVDLFFSYWTGRPSPMSSSASPSRDAPLALSIEIRRERGEDYSTLAGFFKSYELSIVAADERDIIRLRTDVWQEDVRLYRLGVSRARPATCCSATRARSTRSMQGRAGITPSPPTARPSPTGWRASCGRT